MNFFSYPFHMSVPSVILQWAEVCTDKKGIRFFIFSLPLVPHISWYFPPSALQPHSVSSLRWMTSYACFVFRRPFHFSLRGSYLLLLLTHNIAFLGVCCYTSPPRAGSDSGEKLVSVLVAIQARREMVQVPVKNLFLFPQLKYFTLNRKDILPTAVRFGLDLKKG